jgi:hypothetical protein
MCCIVIHPTHNAVFSSSLVTILTMSSTDSCCNTMKTIHFYLQPRRSERAGNHIVVVASFLKGA